MRNNTPNKKVIALIVLGVGAVISLTYGIVTPPNGRRAPPPPQITPREKTKETVDSVVTKRRAVRTKFESWARHPFAPRAGAARQSLSLNGIVGSPKNPKAMISDAIVGVGDTIGKYKVVAIKQDRAILSDGTKEIELKLKQ